MKRMKKMAKVTRIFTRDEAIDVIDSWVQVSSEMVDQSRWTTSYDEIYTDPETGENWLFMIERGSTESQFMEPFEDCDEVVAYKVELKEVTVQHWVEVDE